jgi:hypothetical protein
MKLAYLLTKVLISIGQCGVLILLALIALVLLLVQIGDVQIVR